MSHDRDNLLRGQGLLKQGIAGFAARWRAYATLSVSAVVLGGLGLPVQSAPPEQLRCAFQHGQGRLVTWVASGNSDPEINVSTGGQTARLPASILAYDPFWVKCWTDIKSKAVIGGTLGGLLGFGLCFGFAVWMRDRGRKASLDKVIAGTEIVTERELRRLTKRATGDASIRIATVGIPDWLECRHFAFLGTTGAGKTTVLRQMLDMVEARGEPALVYDTSGEFIAHYYRPERGDVILNPFDARSAYWSPFSEIAHPADADRIARQLVSETGERDDDVWLETSRILVANILRTLNAEGKTTLPDLLNALQAKTKEEMKLWLAGTSSARTFEDDADRATGSVLFMLANVERQQTGNLVVASFRHDTSRAQDPQLHTHNVIMNATRDADGNWRSLEPRALYQLQKAIGAVYRQELAVNVRGLGYELEVGKDSLFEIKGVSADAIKAFSKRATQVEARLAERGQTRETASAAEKQIAALDTRAVKEEVNRADLVKDWRETADSAGFDQAARLALVTKAKMAAAQADHAPMLAATGEFTAHQAVAFAAEKLGERQSVFSTADLEKEAGRFGLGTVTQTQIGAAIDRATKDGALAPRTFIDKRGAEFGGFATATNIDNEQRLLSAEANGRGSVGAIQTPMQAAKAVARAALASEHPWTPDQQKAAKALLTSQNRVTAVQGYAGTAKTTTVLATFAREAEANGLRVTVLSPTASAARTLGEALGIRGETVAKHLMTQALATTNGRSVWIVDEASMLSARDTATLLEAANKANARVILVGDVKQLGSVGAGAAFAQLQDAGMATVKLAEIVRQTNPLTKEAVEASIQGDARRALDALDRGGGKIIAHTDPSERMKAMATDYAALTSKEQRNTIVIDPSRVGRDALNAEIRTQLIASGRLTGEAVTMRTLESKGLTKAEARDARSYEVGDVVRFARDYADKGIARREAVTVKGVDTAKNAVSLEKENGQTVDWRPRQWGAGKSEAFTTGSVELMKGDRIEFTRNDRSQLRENGGRAQVVSVNAQDQIARVRLDSGKFQTLDLTKSNDQHLRHGYVQTAHAAQGRTADRVMIHADSRATNLVDQKMMYVGISRAKTSAAVYTDNRAKLVSGIMERAGEKQMATAKAASNLQAATHARRAGLG